MIRQILTHHAYILLYLAGRPVELNAMKATLHYRTITQEDIALVNLRMGSGALAHLQASFAADDHTADPWTVLIKAIGTDGATRYSYRDWVQNKPAEVHSQTYSAYPYSIYREVEHFVAHVRDGARRRCRPWPTPSTPSASSRLPSARRNRDSWSAFSGCLPPPYRATAGATRRTPRWRRAESGSGRGFR